NNGHVAISSQTHYRTARRRERRAVQSLWRDGDDHPADLRDAHDELSDAHFPERVRVMLHLGASNRKRDQDSQSVTKITPLQRLNRLAASPWVISFISFVVTALVIRSPDITLV